MAAPTVRFRTFPISTAGTAVDTAAERLAAIASQTVISTGSGNELDFGTVDISGGAANSAVKNLIIDYTADGGNTSVDTFKIWLSSNGWDQAGTVLKYRALSGADGTPSATEEYVADAITSTYTFANLDESEPASQNIFPTDEGSSMALSTTSDDALMAAMYVAVADNETTGTYTGTTANYQFQMSFKYSYS